MRIGLKVVDCLVDMLKSTLEGSLSEQLAGIQRDISDFKLKNQLDKVLILWSGNTERMSDQSDAIHGSMDSLLSAIARVSIKIHFNQLNLFVGRGRNITVSTVLCGVDLVRLYLH